MAGISIASWPAGNSLKHFRPAGSRLHHLLFLALAIWLAAPKCASTQGHNDAIRNEIQVGRGLAARLAKKYSVLKNENATRRLNELGRSLATRSSRSELTFVFGILDTQEVNAYSCPGGYILITRGALQTIQTESELAFVLAHEISHVALNHSGRFDESAGLVDFITGIISGGMNVVNTVIRKTTDQLEQTLLENGREHDLEYAADQAGILLASSAGYGFQDALYYLDRLARNQGTQQARTHPSAASRSGRLKHFVASNALPAVSTAGSGRFHEIKAALN